MDATIFSGLQGELVADLTAELKNDPSFDADILSVKVKNAIKDVALRRNYGATSYSNEMIKSDLENYYSIIRSIALFDYNQIGAEGQESHSENSVSRTWVSRESLFNGVIAFVKVF